MSDGRPDSFYEAVGGEPTFRRLVAQFYAGVAGDPVLRALYPEDDLGPAEERLRLFLMQYWGGPTIYSDERGHPRLRMRHAPFAINEAARDSWLRHMRAAVDSIALPPQYESVLWEYLTRAADSMRNTPGLIAHACGTLSRVTRSASGPVPWWANAVFYQVYPRSFADGDGDGSGDLTGLREHLDHLVDLGIDAVWISPFFRSPMADNGYDVSDPCDVDPIFGTLEDFDRLLAAAHERGIRVTIDVVPNHFSDQHPGFQAALAAGAGSPERGRFLFRPGRGADGAEPPNNWPSAFGGPAWQRVDDGEWYLHIFAPEQPDVDWTNPEIAAEFERVFRFWLDRGVDGFRIDVGQGMAKPPGLPDMDLAKLAPEGHGEAHLPSRADLRWDQDGVHEIHRMFRRVLDSYDRPGSEPRMAVGEVWVADNERLALYVRPDELNLAFNFELIVVPWDAAAFREAIDSSIAAMADVGAPCTWVLGNHDVDRPVTRYGNGAAGLARARAAALVQLSLPGAAYLYNGDELGLPNVDLPDATLKDPTWERSGHTVRGRDGERVPLPWRGDAPPYGFSPDGTDTWLPMPTGWGGLGVADQAADPSSTLSFFRTALRLRRALLADAPAALEWLDAPSGVLAYRRGDVTVLLNAGSEPAVLPVGAVLLASGPLDDGTLPPDTAVWVSAVTAG